MDAQQEHDYEMSKRLDNLDLKGSKKKLEAALKKKAKASAASSPKVVVVDPIASAIRNHPTLTRKEAEEMAAAFGF
jgi:hypothetical protein